MEETVLLLLSFICVSCWCQAVVHHLGHHAASSPCEIQHPLETSLVKAYLERPVAVSGCSSDVLTSTGAEVHVLLYHGKKKSHTVELILQNHENKDTIPPFFIYLSSDSAVTWRVHMKGEPVPGSHKFEINRGSRLKFVKKPIKAGPFVTHRKENTLPNERTSLLAQISRKHQDIITSFSELQGGSTITLTVGKGSSTDMDKSCGQGDKQHQYNNLSVSVVDQIPKPVEGCLVNRRDARQNLYNGMRKAFVIELKDIPSDGHFEVNLELKRQSRHTVDEDFWLVLKSPNVISWRVYTKKLKGSINIAANSYVDMSDIRMEPVAIRSEELKDSGVELLRWIEHYLGPVAMYTAMNNSNLIQITLPEMVPEIEEPSKPKEGDQSVAQIKYTLKRSIQTQCDSNSLLIAVRKNILQALNIKGSTMSLVEPQCKALENETHVYILTSSNGCGTNYFDSQHGRMTYVNALVIHSTNTIEETGRHGDSADLLEEDGSGFDIYSGSGEREDEDLVLDDEDLNLKPLQLSFTCSFKTQYSPSMVPIFELDLFHSELYQSPYARYPVDISNPHVRLYLQASVMSNSQFRSHIENCWLSHDKDNNSPRHALVTNGCKVDDSVRQYPSLSKSHFDPQNERLSFTLENYVKQTTSQQVYVMCEMSVCCLEGFRFCHLSDYPGCETLTSDCDPREHRLADPPHRVIIIGPVSLPQKETKYTDTVTDDSVISLNPSNVDASSTKDKHDHVVIEGLDSATVVGIAFAAFIIGVLMMGALWFIHTHSGSIFTSGPFKRSQESRGAAEHDGETTPGSSAPISA